MEQENLELYHILVRHISYYDDVKQYIGDQGGIIIEDWKNLPLLLSANISSTLVHSLNNDARIALCRQPKIYNKDEALDVDLQNISGTWGYDRIDQRTPRLNSRYVSTANGRLPNGGRVNVFIMDAGIQRNHVLIVNNIAAGGYDCFRTPDDPLYTWPESITIRSVASNGTITESLDDHGTHVASIVAQTAPGCLIWPVRVFGGREGRFTSDTRLLEAVSWIIDAHHNIMLTGGNPSVVNMSFGANMRPDAIDRYFVSALIDNGLVVCTSAGNSYYDAFYHSPSGVGVERVISQNSSGQNIVVNIPADGESDYYHKPIVVGAAGEFFNQRDQIWRWSNTSGTNWGDVVDVFTPGERIYGATLRRDWSRMEEDPSYPGHFFYHIDWSQTSTTVRKTGTSMASPMMAGICALWLSQDDSLTHFQIRELIQERSTRNVFDPAQLTHTRVDSFPVTYTNINVYSPNLLSYVWLVPTTLAWQENEYEYVVAPDSYTENWTYAQSVNHNGESEPISYYLDSSSSLPVWIVLTNRTEIIEPGVQRNYFGIATTTQNFDADVEFYVWADDGRSLPRRAKFTIRVVQSRDRPRWIGPPTGNLLGYNLDGSDIILQRGDNVSIIMDAKQEFDSPQPITRYEIIPSINALPVGITWNNGVISGTAGLIPRNGNEFYNFSIRAINNWGLVSMRQFYFRVLLQNIHHYFDTNWLTTLNVRNIDGNVIYDLGIISMGGTIGTQIQVVNEDQDTLNYNIGPIPITTLVNQPDFISNGILPLNARLNTNGYIGGVISSRITPGDYYFRIIVCDDLYCIYGNFVVKIRDDTIVVGNPSDTVEWETPAGNIGDSYESYDSHFNVKARNPEGRDILYEIIPEQSNLPPGITIDSRYGYLVGVMPFVTTTTQYTFTARATVGNNSISRQFWFTVRTLFRSPAIAQIKAHLFSRERIDLQHWLWMLNLIPHDNIFRHDDLNFGRQKNPSMYIASGLELVYSEDVFRALRDYHNKLNIIIGELDWAKANDPAGNHAYDVLFFRITDNARKSGGFYTNPIDNLTYEENLIYPYGVLPSGNSLYFPSSIQNIRYDLIQLDHRSDRTRPNESNIPPHAPIGINLNEAYPFWMTTPQRPNAPPPGFTAVLPIAYLKPGRGLVTHEALRQAGINKRFAGRRFAVDRWYVSSVGTLLTIFDNNTTVFDNNTTIFDNVPALVGKHYKFPPGDKVL
jgi:hypothetical protein